MGIKTSQTDIGRGFLTFSAIDLAIECSRDDITSFFFLNPFIKTSSYGDIKFISKLQITFRGKATIRFESGIPPAAG
jgi:hypothetical protein